METENALEMTPDLQEALRSLCKLCTEDAMKIVGIKEDWSKHVEVTFTKHEIRVMGKTGLGNKIAKAITKMFEVKFNAKTNHYETLVV